MNKFIENSTKNYRFIYLAYSGVVLTYLFILLRFLYLRRIHFPNGSFGGSLSREISIGVYQFGLILIVVGLFLLFWIWRGLRQKKRRSVIIFNVLFIFQSIAFLPIGYLFYKWQLKEGKYVLYLLIPMVVISIWVLINWVRKGKVKKQVDSESTPIS